MITKLKVCSVCKSECQLWKSSPKLCKGCAMKTYKPLVSKPKVLTDEEKQFKADKNDFFSKVAETMPFNCMNCNRPLYAFNKFAKRCVSAHILPKAHFESIATNEDNILFLGSDLILGCGCHDFYDASMAKRTSMKIYPLVLERFETLKNYLTQAEIVEAEKYLNINQIAV